MNPDRRRTPSSGLAPHDERAELIHETQLALARSFQIADAGGMKILLDPVHHENGGQRAAGSGKPGAGSGKREAGSGKRKRKEP
jgi:hypothetical protein